MSDHWRDLQDLFDELCVLDPQHRCEILEQRCKDDAFLRSDVERLLRSYDEERAANRELRVPEAGRRFGAWQTTALLARGGMGEVWLASRADGQHEQQAALKILSPYLASPDSLDRFRRERQTLALLDHPNIARLLDGGMSPQGEPYLVMEYVEGVRLDGYCEDRGLTIPERLRLMIKVCAAVHSAHQYFIVHRDLKPSNILVNKNGEPKLLDFGIAKVVDSEKALEQTATANVFLTPAYACPEVLHGEPVTVASDIYSLGVVLFELLAGHRPFDPSKLGPAGWLEAITERDAPRPSSLAPAKWKTAIEGDLDSIVLKALAKNPRDRYASAAQFADDLKDYLAGEPVIAVPPSGWYIARKFICRNRAMVAAAAVLALSLAAGIAGTLWQAHVARQERFNADQRFNDARKLANYVLFDLYDSVGKIPGAMPVQADMERRGLEYLDRLAAFKSRDSQLRLELAEGYMKLGSILGRRLDTPDSLGDNKRAIETDRKALALVEPLVAEHPDNLEAERALASINEQLGYSLSTTGPYDEAFRRLRQAADLFEKIAVKHSNDPRSLQDAGTAWQTLGKQLGEKGGYVSFDIAEPHQYLQKAVIELDAALKLNPADPSTLVALATAYESTGRLDSLGDPAKGIVAYSEALKLLDRLPRANQQAVTVRQLRAMMLIHNGWNRGQLGDLKTALADLNEGVPELSQLASADPTNAMAAYRLMDGYRSLGLVQGYAGKNGRSLESLKKATLILDDLAGRDPANKIYGMLRAELQGRVANLLVDAGRKDEARGYAEPSVAYFKKLGEDPSATPQQLLSAIRSVAECGVESLRDYSAALRFSLRADQAAHGKDPAILGYLAESYALNHDFSKAVAAAQRGLQATPSKPGEPPTRLQQWLTQEVADYKAKRQ